MREKKYSQSSALFVALDKIDKNNEIFQFHLVEWMSAHLTDCSRFFQGDLIEMLVLTIVGQVYLRSYSYSSTQKYNLENEEISVSISYISDTSGIPKETVRRKLASLKKRGWIEQCSNGEWSLSIDKDGSIAKRDLQELYDRGIARIFYLIENLNPYLK